jgi:hypothetical protein
MPQADGSFRPMDRSGRRHVGFTSVQVVGT